MKKVYHLSPCSTCQGILKESAWDDLFQQQDIKTSPISEKQIDEMMAFSGSAETLFSRGARKCQTMRLGQKILTESDYRQLILNEHTFLKRPVLIVDDQIFIGNAKNTLTLAKEAFKA